VQVGEKITFTTARGKVRKVANTRDMESTPNTSMNASNYLYLISANINVRHRRAVDSHCLPFRCVVSNCERKFGRKGELVKHSRMHQEEKPELRSQASQTDAMPEAQSLLEQSKVNAQNNSETVEHFFASCYDTFNHISAARLAKRIEATIRVGKLANILTKSIAELYSQIPSICQPQQGCFWQDSKNKVLTPNNDVFQDREFFQDKNFIDIFQENEFMDGITKSWLDLSSTTLKALIAGTHPASYFLELARVLWPIYMQFLLTSDSTLSTCEISIMLQLSAMLLKIRDFKTRHHLSGPSLIRQITLRPPKMKWSRALAFR